MRHAVIDIETYDPLLRDLGESYIFNQGHILGVGIYIPETGQKGYYDPKDAFVKDILKDPETIKVFHNGIYDLSWLNIGYGYPVKGRIEDTMTRATLLDSYVGAYSLDACCMRMGVQGKNKDYTIDAWWKDHGGKGKAVANLARMPRDVVAKYCIGDIEATWELFQAQRDPIHSQNLDGANDIECRLYPFLMEMKRNGIRIDVDKRQQLSAHLTRLYDDLYDELYKTYGLVPEISKASYLEKIWRKEHLPILFTSTGRPSFAADVLEDCRHPVAEKIRRMRGIQKLLNTFIDGALVDYQVNGHIYPELFPALRDEGGTVTGRYSSRNPNCVTMDTLIFTEHGYEPYSETATRVWSATGWRQITDRMVFKNRPVVRIKLENGMSIGATEDSKVACLTEDGIQWIEYKDLQVGNLVLIPVDTPDPGDSCVSVDLAYVIGCLTAEGHKKSFFCTDKEYAEQFQQAWYAVFGYAPTIHTETRGSRKCVGYALYPSRKREDVVLESAGYDLSWLSGDKRVAKGLWAASKESICAYLRGYFQGDGWSTNRTTAASSNSLQLLRDIQLLCTRVGIQTTVSGPYLHKSEFGEGNQYYLRIKGPSLAKFQQSVLRGNTRPFKRRETIKGIGAYLLKHCNHKQIVWRQGKGKGTPIPLLEQYWSDDPHVQCLLKYNLRTSTITSIEHTIEDVYDYSVETQEGILGGPHYIANGIVQFDCQNMPAREDKFGTEVRSLFIPEEGCVLGAYDYKQIEYRVFLHFASGEGAEVAKQRFRDNPDTDYHQMTIDLMEWQSMGKEGRHLAKNFNFTCISPDSFIATRRGYVRARDLKETDKLVLDSGEWRAFIGQKPQYRFTLSNGQQFCVTTDHPFRLFGEEVGAQTIQEGQIWDVVPNTYWGEIQTETVEASFHKVSKPYEFAVDERFAYMLGTWLGDGSLHMQYKTGEPQALSFTTTPEQFEYFKQYLGDKVHIQRTGPNWIVWGYSNKVLATWVRDNCGMTTTKHVPDVIYRSPRRVVIAFMKGLLDSDGTVYKNIPQIFNTNEALMRGVARCAAMLGWPAYWINEHYNTDGHEGDLFRLRFASIPETAAEFQGLKRTWKPVRKHKVDQATVVRKEEIGIQDTFCISLPPPHWYEAECCINHNSIYGLGPRSFAVKFKHSLMNAHPDADPDNLFPLAKSLMDEYFRKVPFAKHTCNNIQNTCLRRGYVRTLSGRRQRIPADPSTVYKIVNYLVQGSASDILKKGQVDAWEAGVFNVLKAHITVHDENVFSAPKTKEGVEACKEFAECMSNAYQLTVPIGVDMEMGLDWGHCTNDFRKEYFENA